MRLNSPLWCTAVGLVLSGALAFAETTAKSETDIPASLLSPISSADVNSKPPQYLDEMPDLLARVREANQLLYSNLQSFVCNEQMERFKGSLSVSNTHHIDTVTAKVSFESGVEHYSDIFQDKRLRTDISNVAGAWSEGEFGTLLQQTQILLSTQPVLFRMKSDVKGVAAAVYEVQVAQENSPWDLEVAHHHYRIPFRTEVWVSQASGQVLRIVRVSSAIPSSIGISEIRWGVTLEQVEINDRNWLLPQTGSYEVRYAASDRREWNNLTFSDYHRYGAETALVFQ